MLVMMKHPKHGRLPVYSVSEVESNKAAGWIVDPDAPENQKSVAAPKPAPVIVEPAPAAPAPKPTRKSFFAPSSDSEV